MIQLKRGIDLANLTPQMALAATVVASIYREDFKANLVVTSGRDGDHTHLPHYLGYALDFRTRHLVPGDRACVQGRVQSALGDQYDVILEDDHLHVEFDPRT